MHDKEIADLSTYAEQASTVIEDTSASLLVRLEGLSCKN